MKHLDIRVKGRVQGVFFRVSTMEKAKACGVKGTVRNEPDGSVFIEAEGKDRGLDDLVAWCKQGGPPHASVSEVDVQEGELKNYDGFEIVG